MYGTVVDDSNRYGVYTRVVKSLQTLVFCKQAFEAADSAAGSWIAISEPPARAMVTETGTYPCSLSSVGSERAVFTLVCPTVADAHFEVGLDEIGLEDSDGNRRALMMLLPASLQVCYMLLYTKLTLSAFCRGFSWEKNYPGDEGISGTLQLRL